MLALVVLAHLVTSIAPLSCAQVLAAHPLAHPLEAQKLAVVMAAAEVLVEKVCTVDLEAQVVVVVLVDTQPAELIQAALAEVGTQQDLLDTLALVLAEVVMLTSADEVVVVQTSLALEQLAHTERLMPLMAEVVAQGAVMVEMPLVFIMCAVLVLLAADMAAVAVVVWLAMLALRTNLAARVAPERLELFGPGLRDPFHQLM